MLNASDAFAKDEVGDIEADDDDRCVLLAAMGAQSTEPILLPVLIRWRVLVAPTAARLWAYDDDTDGDDDDEEEDDNSDGEVGPFPGGISDPREGGGAEVEDTDVPLA